MKRLARATARRLSRRRVPGSAKASTGKKPASQPDVLEVPIGNAVRGKFAGDASVVMFVMVGLEAEQLEQLVDEVTALQVMLGNFRPVFVTDCDQFHVFRRRQYLFEYIPPHAEWTAHFGDTEWQSFVNERIHTVTERYQPDRVIAFEDPAKLTMLRSGLLDALVSKAPQDPAADHDTGMLVPLPPTPVGLLIRKSAEIYLQTRALNPRKLAWRAGRFLNRRARTLLPPK